MSSTHSLAEGSGGTLTIKAERNQETEEQAGKFYRRKHSWGAVGRHVALPADVDETVVDAELENGVLTVSLLLSEPRGPKSIAIRGE